MINPDITSFEFKAIPSPLTVEAQQLSFRRSRSPLHIMVIDDDPITHHFLARFLGKDCDLLHCERPLEAVTSYLRFLPDLVFIDINLSDEAYHGLDVLHNISRYDPAAYAVMLSAHPCEDNIALAEYAGARGFVAKPFSPMALLQHLHACETAKLYRE